MKSLREIYAEVFTEHIEYIEKTINILKENQIQYHLFLCRNDSVNPSEKLSTLQNLTLDIKEEVVLLNLLLTIEKSISDNIKRNREV